MADPHLFILTVFIDGQNELDALQADFQVTGGRRPQVDGQLPRGGNLQRGAAGQGSALAGRTLHGGPFATG